MAPAARPCVSVVTLRTLHRVFNCAPCRIAEGQWVMSKDALAPSGQPGSQVPIRAQRVSSPTRWDAIALGAGHQCQPNLFIPVAARRPTLPIGCGGSGGTMPGGYIGSPSTPDKPIARSILVWEGARKSELRGQASPT